MRLRVILAVSAAFGLMGCDLNTPTEPGTPIDCSTLATTLAAAAPTLTTTASGLQFRDVTVGTGAAVRDSVQVSVRYAGCITTGLKFDSNEAPAGLLTFAPHRDDIIAGFAEGVIGMKVGGRRQLVIPPALGYGAQANGPIPANSVLVFTIDAISTP